MLLATQRVHGDRKKRKFQQKEVLRKMAEVVPREADEIMSQLVEEEEDEFIEEDCSVYCASPPIYDTYPDKEMSSIHQVDFLGVDAILPKTFNQSCDEIYRAETTFLSKSKGLFVSSLGIIMAYGKSEAQEKHEKSIW
jgi:hypothetical protein